MSAFGRRTRLTLASLLALLVPHAGGAPPGKAAPPPQPHAKASAKAAAKAAAEKVDAVVAELKREYAAHLKNPESAPLRPQCTWFIDHPQSISPEAIVAALNQPLGGDGRMVAYVKWQLLSGLPPKVEDPALLPRLLAAYAAAPQPVPRYGLAAGEKAQLDAALKDARREDDLVLTSKLDERVGRWAQQNKPVLAYRDELYARLPEGSFEALVAGFRDAAERTKAAAGGGVDDRHAGKVVDDALAWAQSGSAEPRQLAHLAKVVARLRHLRSPPYYAEAKYQRTERLGWSNRTDAVYSPKKLETLEKLLRDAHATAAADAAAGNAAARRNGRPGNAGAK